MENNFIGSVVEVCVSDRKGTKKVPVGKAIVKENYGIVGDAHAGTSKNREISILDIESIAKMKKHGFDFKPGDFAENITTKGIDLTSMCVGTILLVGSDVTLEVTQIGKKCHSWCEIKKIVGFCIMPTEGIFTRVLKGGSIKKGDKIRKIEVK